MDIRLLGAVEAVADGRAVDIGHARQRAVLAVLAVDAGTVLSTDTLADRVWGPDNGARHRDSLYNYISRLRRALPGVIARRGGGYVFDEDPRIVDLHRFRALVADAATADDASSVWDEALGLWRGEAFDGIDVPWLSGLAIELETERYDAWLSRNDAVLDAGEPERVVSEVERAARERPGDERLAAQAMLALSRTGRRAEALARFEATRRHLLEHLGADPGTRLRETHRRVLSEDDEPAASAAPAAVPRQVPHLAGHFTGRGAELARLDALTSGDTPIVTLCGPGGIGKTWLAQRWANDNAPRFSDGQLYVDLHGFDPAQSPMTSEHALRVMLAALHVAESSIPSDLDAASGLLRSLTNGRRMLVILDNVRDHRQVLPLLPGTGTVTVVTSRLDLAGLMASHGAGRVALTTLDDTDARRALVAQLGGERLAVEPEAVADLIGHCGGLPLALGILAANASVRPDLPLSRLAADLRDRAGILDGMQTGDLSASLRSVCEASVRALTPDAQSTFTLLGLGSTTALSADAIASLTASRGPAVRRDLREIENAHLVERDVHGRYRMHDLTYLYASERAAESIDPARQDSARRRLVDHYVQTSYAVACALTPERARISRAPAVIGAVTGTADRSGAVEWFDVEYANLLAAQQIADRLDMDEHAWRLGWTVMPFQWAQARMTDGVAMANRALGAARRLGDPEAMTVSYVSLGRMLTRAGDFDRAAGALESGIALAERVGDFQEQLHAHAAFALISELRGDYPTALDKARRVLDVAVASGNTLWRGRALNAVGYYQAHLGELDSARESCEAALAIFMAGGHEDSTHDTYDSLAYIAARAGEHARAVELYQKSMDWNRRNGNMYTVADGLGYFGDSLMALGDTAAATEAWRESVRLLRSQRRDDLAQSIQDKLDAV
ncbi:MAG TPA: BTAD domain-containing putative transcriptional regulator [Stackebrandtia sp.]|jgi:DNA-binding SARP family transcriptional activator|uniref:AfsR/SARP family transcriptional regulator n=1 Tax=Stackebrandtia sp. TaxID=2023065 RepID=UPI002D46E8DF|nr:BTAD domain-containing putative transcriptional regulator [Stackebrandtia sp.]HZE38515.1 BTAD domain-containing putative transcriptional regulator [Stackebrandtia sp.]